MFVRGVERSGRLLSIGLVLCLLGACGSEVGGTAQQASGQDGLFDPCKEVPAAAIESVGLDPSTADPGIEITSQKACEWTGPWYFFGILSRRESIDEIKGNVKFSGFESLKVGDRSGVQFHSASDQNMERCFVALPANGGSIWLSVSTKTGDISEEPTCPLTVTYVRSLEEFLPR
ncbi:hypothetical protein ABH922_002061 [Rhodococcus sp. 27YEA15]|uniref:DUF3558 domain-containing protein n=1 Tax=Rhodococcus sp. 27YEA15 TaxID=3156259 RepID=UPI003C7A3E8E